jgi:hypothetical protein
LTSQILRAKKIGLKSFFGKVIRTFCQKSDFSVFEKKFRFFFPNGLKIGVPTIFTILYPNLQKKLGFCEIFGKFWKESKIRLFGKSRIKNPKNKKMRKFFFILCVEWDELMHILNRKKIDSNAKDLWLSLYLTKKTIWIFFVALFMFNCIVLVLIGARLPTG